MEDDEDEGEVQPVALNPALVGSCVLTLASDLTGAVSEFFGAVAHLLAAHYVHTACQREMHDQAVLEIETLTQGD